jgi:hypothetical protein
MFTGIAAAIFGGLIKIATSGFLKSVLEIFGKQTDAQSQIAVTAIQAEIEARKGARDIRLATAGFWEMRLITFAIAFPFVAHLWLVAFDTFFAFSWNVAAFPKPFDEWEGAILMSFFGLYGGLKAVNAITGLIGRYLTR